MADHLSTEPPLHPPPRYAPGARRGSFLARFTSGESLEVEPGRARLYPGLRGEAPSTAAFYDAFSAFLGSGRVLDAGVGAARLLSQGLEVVAAEQDAATVAFARQLAPGAEHLTVDLVQLRLERPVDGAIIADVLSQALEPEAALLAVGRAMKPGAPLLVAEPAAHVSQRLGVPQRRAFSPARLRSMLVRTGFRVETVICDRVPFVAFLAKAQHSGVADAFASAYALAAEGAFAEALTVLNAVRASYDEALELEILLAESELYLAQGDGDRAANACFLAQKLAAGDARPLVGLGRVALGSGAASDALHLALDALRRDATEAAAYALAAVAADALGHPDAFTAWRAASNLAPDDLIIAGELARSTATRGDHTLGLLTLDRAERYGVTLEAEHHVTRAWLLIAAGRHTDAATEVRVARASGATPADLSALESALQRR
jgi:tetratricopeptide (TPR) repeat protein